MCFVPVRSRHGPWIVGVGGNTARDYGPETIVYNIKTGDVILGPKLLSTKSYPVVLPIGDRILARKPSVKGEVNFVPWFEVLDLSQAQVADGHLTGTYMFDTVTEQWAKLDDGDLPFAGGATPHGHLFLGFSRSSKEITLYKIAICASAASPSIKAECSSLSIAEFRVVADMEAGEHVASSGRFVSLGNHDNPGFCSFRCCSNNTAPFDFEHTRELVTMRTYTSESQDQLQSTRALLISKRWKQMQLDDGATWSI
ncbi:hypothetical protein PR202_ga15360 [Eleusine coracana subsp. coracana]|uniref:Uncharacterized protein n=1 Tax=Eleusine coracana subsp. coracana TaxID=191504 RepID=A0AAV5CK02_ELECO|nr:hypothetical protein PR202_ga15360 [Eleusine coracana subsp. coracana]